MKNVIFGKFQGLTLSKGRSEPPELDSGLQTLRNGATRANKLKILSATGVENGGGALAPPYF